MSEVSQKRDVNIPDPVLLSKNTEKAEKCKVMLSKKEKAAL